MEWSLEQDEIAEKMRAAGASLGEVATVLGTTRNAVAGRAHRLKWPVPRDPRPQAKRAKPRLKRLRPVARIETGRPHIVKIIPPQAPAARARTIMDIGVNECRFPLSDRWPWPLCGAPTRADTPYCPDHCSVCYGRR
jgi:hypothetical protein